MTTKKTQFEYLRLIDFLTLIVLFTLVILLTNSIFDFATDVNTVVYSNTLADLNIPIK
jgi:hypothetical protein